MLVIGASGGVGSFAVQLAKAFGAEVTGVASTAKVDLVRSLGADHVLDYTREDFADGTRRYDVVLDIGGNSSLSRLRRALTPTGTLVIAGGEGGGRWLGGTDRQLRAMALSPFVGQRLTPSSSKEGHEDMLVLAEMVEAGKVTPAVDRTYPLGEAPEASATSSRAGPAARSSSPSDAGSVRRELGERLVGERDLLVDQPAGASQAAQAEAVADGDDELGDLRVDLVVGNLGHGRVPPSTSRTIGHRG